MSNVNRPRTSDHVSHHRHGTRLDIAGFFLICLWILTVFNRGGAAVGIGAIGTPHLLVLLAPVSYLVGHGRSLPRRDLLLIFPIAIIFVIGILHHTNEGASSEQLVNSSPLFYPIVILAGVYFARKRPRQLLKFYWHLFIAVTLLGISAPVVRAVLSNVVIVNGYSLFGFYGSYYTVVIAAFCYFFTRPMELRSVALTITAAAAIFVLGSRSGMIALLLSVICLFLTTEKAQFTFKSSLMAASVIAALVFIFPFFNYFSSGLRGDFSATYYMYALQSVLIPEAGMDEFGTSFIGSRTHRLEMAAEVFRKVLSTKTTALFGIGVSDALVETSFRNPHNGYATFLGRSGFVGLTALLWLISYIAITLRSWGQNPDGKLANRDRAFGWAVLVSGVWMIGFTTMLDSPMNAVPFFFLIGAIFGRATPYSS